LSSIRNTPQEVSYVLQHSGATVILVDSEFKHLVSKDLPSNITVIVSQDSGGKIKDDQYEHFLNHGRKIWEELDSKAGKWGKRGWELIEGVEDEEAACALC